MCLCCTVWLEKRLHLWMIPTQVCQSTDDDLECDPRMGEATR